MKLARIYHADRACRHNQTRASVKSKRLRSLLDEPDSIFGMFVRRKAMCSILRTQKLGIIKRGFSPQLCLIERGGLCRLLHMDEQDGKR